MYKTTSSHAKGRRHSVRKTPVRKTLFGFGAGGYIVGAHLSAKKMGLGLRDTRRSLAIETAAIIERSLARGELVPRVTDMLKRTSQWPIGVRQALGGHEGENMLETRLHEELGTVDPKSQRERVQIKWKHERLEGITYVTAILLSTTTAQRTIQRFCRSNDDKLATVKCLAEIIETTRKGGATVTLEDNLPRHIEEAVAPFRDVYATLGLPNRVFYSVVARTKVHRFQAPLSVPAFGVAESVQAELIPDAYPLVVKLWGQSGVVTGSTRKDLTEALDKRQETEFWEGNRQLLEVCACLHSENTKGFFSLEKTCPIAGIRRGVYHTSEMKTRRANMLMRVFTGAEFKTVERTSASGERKPRKPEDYCKAPGCQGKLLSLYHMLDHVPMEDRRAAVAVIKNLGYKWNWNHEYPNLHCLLGLVHRGMTNYVPCQEDEKEHTQFLKKAAAIFAELGLQAIEKCLGKVTYDDTPELEVEEKHLNAKDYKHQCYADAALHIVKLGGDRTYYLGLGGLIKNKLGTAAKFQVRVEVPVELFNSTIGEHLAHIVLIKAAKHYECDDPCFLCDNNSVPAHLEGDFACNTAEVNVIRRTTYSLLGHSASDRGWLPRLKNVEADKLAKEAAKGKHDPSKYPERLFTEMRIALAEAIKVLP